MTTTAQAYGSEATLTDDALTIRATSKTGRFALFGQDPRNEITLPLAEIASAEHYYPSAAARALGANGRLDVHTVDGRRYQVHYRVKKNQDVRPLADALVAAVNAAQSA